MISRVRKTPISTEIGSSTNAALMKSISSTQMTMGMSYPLSRPRIRNSYRAREAMMATVASKRYACPQIVM